MDIKKLTTIKKKSADETWSHYYTEHEFQFGSIAFVLGFLWDVFTLSDIDDTLSILQQICYLAFIGIVIHFENKSWLSGWEPAKDLSRLNIFRLWKYREPVAHFFLGSLLSLYSLYFFKSASISTSFAFLILMIFLLVANEFPFLQAKGPVVRMAIWTLCLASFFLGIMPLIIGSLGLTAFLLSMLAALLGLYFLFFPFRKESNKKQIGLFSPSLGILIFFTLAYIFKLTPPVPLALKSIGIYHNVEKIKDDYVLTEDRAWWKFWHSGDQFFLSKPGDKIFVFMEIYSPVAISDTVNIRWAKYDSKNGWSNTDAIPMKISGGRSQGYRGVSYKSNYTAGKWRVYIETSDGLEIGRINLEVEKAG